MEDIDVIDVQNGIEVSHRLNVLDKDHDHGLIVGLFEVVCDTETLAVCGHAAMADGGKLGGVNDQFGLFGCVDMRDHDPLRAAIQSPVDDVCFGTTHTNK